MTYNPSLHTTSNKPVAISGKPLDARSMYYDQSTYTYRPYASVDEVLSYLKTDLDRQGLFPVYISSPEGPVSYWFANGTRDRDLVVMVNNEITDKTYQALKEKADLVDGKVPDEQLPVINRETLGLDKVDNTPDAKKPISEQVQRELENIKQDITNIENIGVVEGANIITSDTPPEDTRALWVDMDTSLTEEDGDPAIQEIRSSLFEVIQKVSKMAYAFERTMDSGDFNNKAGSELDDSVGIEPGTDIEIDPELGEMEEPEDSDIQPNIKHFQVKRGSYAQFKHDTLKDGELGYVKDRNLLYIGNNGVPKLIGSAGGSGGGDGGGGASGTEFYLDLKHPENDTVHRVAVNSAGEIYVYNAAIDDAQDHEVMNPTGENIRGLYISMVYAGGEMINDNQFNVCSHSFVELYNRTESPINLKGISLQYATGGTRWNVLPLRGIIPAGSAFLIRARRCTPEGKGLNTTLVEIDDFDMEWDIPLSDIGMKLYLRVGLAACTEINPYRDGVTMNEGYIDLVGLGGAISNQTIDGYETAFPNILNKKRCIYRTYFADYNQRPANTKFGDTNNNKADFRFVEYDRNLHVDNPTVYKPWTSKQGKKDLYFNKNGFDTKKPNLLTVSFGRDANTTRTFNWISVGYYDEQLQIRAKGSDTWLFHSSINDPASPYNRQRVKGFDGVWFTVHKIIVTGLTAGTYEYRAGRPGYFSDVHEFEVKTVGQNDAWDFVWTSDQQAWSWEEYEPWRIALEHIEKWENNKDQAYPATGTGKFDWILNTGDMVENGIRPHEWLYYYEAGKKILPNYSQINVVGNNDLCPNPGELVGKINPTSFEYFYCYEHNPANLPIYTHPVTKEVVWMKSVYSFDYGNTHFIALNSNNYIDEQKEWFDKDIAQVRARAVQPRWIIVLIHDAPFNIHTDKDPKRDTPFNQISDPNLAKRYSWSRKFEAAGVHLVLSGHKHTYSRSKPVLEDVGPDGVVIDPIKPIVQTLGAPGLGETKVDEITGVYYIMCQSTGSKLDSNKDVPAQSIVWNGKWFPGEGSASQPISSAAQKYPTYVKMEISQDKIVHRSYQIKNIMPASSYSYDAHNPITQPKERILIDSSEITRL